MESVSSYIKGRQQQRINTAVTRLRNDKNKIRNDLKQHKNELLMYGRYNINSLKGIINTINALHDRQSYYEWAVKERDFNFRKTDIDAVNYNFDTTMYLSNAREEHVVTYRKAVKAARDFLDGIVIVTQGRLPRSLISDNQLREILGKVGAMVKRNYPDYVLAAKHISHYRDMNMVTFSVDQQLSSCANNSSSKMHMKFTINLAFWELFKKRSPNSASNIQPQYVEEEQVFSVSLYDLQIGKLDQPVDLEKFMETMGTDGQKMFTIEEREAEQPMQKIMPRWLNNILVMTCTAMTTELMIIILVLLAKHFKMKALVSMIAIQTVQPPAQAVNLTAAMMSAMIAPDPAIGTKVVCAYPVAIIWQNILGYLVLAYAITQFFRPVTWCKGYKYNKKCALYIFVYDADHERYSPLKIMSLKGQMHNYRMKYTGEGISLTLVRSWTYDTMTISWGGVQVMDKSDPINLPTTVTVALRHKIMTRRIAQQLGEVQYMLKQGSSSHDITDYYRARKKIVNLRVESGDKGVTSSPKKVRKEKSHKKTKVQEEPVEV